MLKLRSSIRSSLMRFVLFRGTLIAALGGTLLLYGAIALPENTLRLWGLPILLIAGGLMTIGMLPYRKLTQLEKNPYEIIAPDEKSIHFAKNGKALFIIPVESVERTAFLDRGDMYGIRIWLKRPIPQKMIVQDPKFNMEKFQKDSLKKFNCDLFLPYFSAHSYASLKDEG
jgi:hypothetical protein